LRVALAYAHAYCNGNAYCNGDAYRNASTEGYSYTAGASHAASSAVRPAFNGRFFGGLAITRESP
jgi:hypothetical protein